MSPPPTVSVVIPTYNRATLLPRAIQSVQEQTFTDWEVVVVDDASSDDTTTRIGAMDDGRVRAVRRDVNGGVAAAQNTGIDHATGRYICFLHSDDEYMPGRLSTLVRKLEDSPSAVGVESGYEIVEPRRTVPRGPYLDGASARDLLEYRVGIHISPLLLRREAAAAIRFDEQLRGTEDRDFCIRLLRLGQVVTSRDVLVRIHRDHPRLAHQAKGPTYEYLLSKYSDDIEPFPKVHAEWLFRIARAHARAGDLDSARASMRHCVTRYPHRARRWPLLATAYLSSAAFRSSLRAYVGASRALTRERRRR
jgi:glycosyltransferase involved in cell wall biosynthesis